MNSESALIAAFETELRSEGASHTQRQNQQHTHTLHAAFSYCTFFIKVIIIIIKSNMSTNGSE